MRVLLLVSILVLGACDRGPAIFSDTWIFDPASDTWSSGPDLPGGITGHSATLLIDGTVLLAGGASLDLEDDLVRCDLVVDRCDVLSSLAEQHELHDAALLPDGRVLLVGGDIAANPEVVDPALLESQIMRRSGTDRARLAVLEDGRVLALSDVSSVFDGGLNAWIGTGAPIVSRVSPALARLDDGRVISTGGYCVDCTETSTEFYDPATSTWSVGPSMLTGHEGHTATRLDDGRVLIIGGASPFQQVFAEILDPVTGVSTSTGDARCNVIGHRSTSLGDGRVLVTGGHLLGPGEYGPVPYSLFDPVSGDWTHGEDANGLTWRMAHDATLMPDGRVLVTGGDIGYLGGRAAN